MLSDAHHVCQTLEGSGGRCRKPQRYADVRHGLFRGRRRRRRKTGDGQTHSTRRQRQRGLTSTKTRPEQEAEGVVQTIRRRHHSTGVRVRRLPGVWRMTTANSLRRGCATLCSHARGRAKLTFCCFICHFAIMRPPGKAQPRRDIDTPTADETADDGFADWIDYKNRVRRKRETARRAAQRT